MATRDWKACVATCNEKSEASLATSDQSPHIQTARRASSRSKSFSRFVAPSFHGSNNLKKPKLSVSYPYECP